MYPLKWVKSYVKILHTKPSIVCFDYHRKHEQTLPFYYSEVTTKHWWVTEPISNIVKISVSSTADVLVKGAPWMNLFEAKHGLGGEGVLGKPHAGDEWLLWSITVYFSLVIQMGMPTSKPGSFLRGIPLILGHANEQGLLQAPTPDWGVQRHCQQSAMGITYQGMASNWTKLSLSNLLWHYSLA